MQLGLQQGREALLLRQMRHRFEHLPADVQSWRGQSDKELEDSNSFQQ